MSELPGNFELCYSRSAISGRISELGREVTLWVDEAEQRTGKRVLAIGILRGAVFFYADFLRTLSTNIEVGFLRAQAYAAESDELTPEVKVWPNDIKPSGRAVLLIDDMCDSGATLKELENLLRAQGAEQVRSVVVIHRQSGPTAYHPTWAAFHYPGQEWFVGYGMDSQDEWRNLPDIYRIVR